MPEIPAPTISTSTWVVVAVCSIADSLLAVVGVVTMLALLTPQLKVKTSQLSRLVVHFAPRTIA